MSEDTIGVNDFFDDLMERRRSYPWWRRVWWTVYRRWEATVMLPRRAKWFIQRGARGWSDADLWSLDHYIAEWLPGALRALKERKHGTPMDMFDGLETDATGNPTKGADAIGIQRWESVMDQMIAGFEAWRRATEGLYESEMGEYEMYRPDGMSREAWRALRHERFERREKLVKRDMATFETGIALFAKHFGGLWD